MNYSYIVYKKDGFDKLEPGLRLGIIAQLGEETVVGFKKPKSRYQEALADYDPNYNSFVLDNLPRTVTSMVNQPAITASGSSGSSISTNDPAFITELRKRFASNIQISRPKYIEADNAKTFVKKETARI